MKIRFSVVLVGLVLGSGSLAVAKENNLRPQDFEGKYVLSKTKDGICSPKELTLKYDVTIERLYSEENRAKRDEKASEPPRAYVDIPNIGKPEEVSHESEGEPLYKGVPKLIGTRHYYTKNYAEARIRKNRLIYVRGSRMTETGRFLIVGGFKMSKIENRDDYILDAKNGTLTHITYDVLWCRNAKLDVCIYTRQ